MVRNFAGSGIVINNGYNSLVQRSHIFGMGQMGVRVIAGIRSNLTASNHMVFANTIHSCAKWILTRQPGVWAGKLNETFKLLN